MTMTPVALTLAILLTSVLAGLVGSMLGLGGGIIIVPALTLFFGYDFRTAVAASAVAIIATSTGAAVAYLRDHITNTRIAMFLEIGSTLGALSGAFIAGYVPARFLFLLFAALMAYSAFSMFRARKSELREDVVPDRLSERLQLRGAYYDKALGRTISYRATGALPGLLLMYVSGAFAGLLGVGGGTFKVPAMDIVMKLPIKVSTATSNFMIGVTAAASAAVYFVRGDVQPLVAGPVALGVLCGALLGSRLMVRMKGSTLRLLFVPLLVYVAVQMAWKGVTY
ncbi:MAG: sulfite exporter TauE/SafE family protein [Symbiobacterium thermophilum]|nr:sulfite exporter TauE/SafE family protein [Symbiobacterium thermophilum]MBY6278146.1 sulfite exporter TauE/SafE family protein [Symbiobacterium thermophilum]